MVIQVFIGVSLGAGIDKLIDENENMPSIFDVILMPDIYLPVIGIIGYLVVHLFQEKFLKINSWCPDLESTGSWLPRACFNH